MKRSKFTFLAMVALLYFGCTDNNLTGPHYANQFPLRVGIFWEYESVYYTLQRRILNVDKGPGEALWYLLETTMLHKSDTLLKVISLTFLTQEGTQLREYEYQN